MAIGLGTMIIVLEEGNEKDWLESDFILRGTILAITSLVIFVVIQLKRSEPFINLRLLARRNFLMANMVGVTLGFALYGSVFLLPIYLVQVHQYNAMQIGMVMMWVGVPQLVTVPIVLRLMKFVDLRILIAIGMLIFSLSSFLNAQMSLDYGFDHLVAVNFIRGLGMPFIMVPLNTVATFGIETKHIGSASGLFSVLRNLGGAVGIAVLATFLSIRQQFHSSHILESVSAYNPLTIERLRGLGDYFGGLGADPMLAQQQALLAVDAIARRESFILAFNDCFYAICVFLWISLFFISNMRLSGNAQSQSN